MITKISTRSQHELSERIDPYLEAWRRLVEAEGIGPSRLHTVLMLDPECGDEDCLYFDPLADRCHLLKASVPWSRGPCRMRTPRATRMAGMQPVGRSGRRSTKLPAHPRVKEARR